MMEFLYFPEDKSEYIPAAIMCIIFILGAVATMYLFLKKGKKQEAIAIQQEKEVMNKYNKTE